MMPSVKNWAERFETTNNDNVGGSDYFTDIVANTCRDSPKDIRFQAFRSIDAIFLSYRKFSKKYLI